MFLIPIRIQQDIITNVHSLHVQCLLFLSAINETANVDRYSKITQTSNVT